MGRYPSSSAFAWASAVASASGSRADPGAARASTTPRASTSLDRRRFAGDTSCASTSCSLASLDASPSPTASEDGPPHRAPFDAADDISTEPAVAGARLSGGALADAVVETRVRVARPRERS